MLFGGLPWTFLYGGNPADPVVGFFWELFGYVLPFAIGVFLSLFLIAPVRPGMTVVSVGVRGLIASTVGRRAGLRGRASSCDSSRAGCTTSCSRRSGRSSASW